MLKPHRYAVLGVALVLMLLVPPGVRADDDIDTKAVSRAKKFLDGAKRGRDILSLMHFGTKYAGHKYMGLRGIKDRDGNKVPGEFALVYTFDWNDDGTSDVAFLCDRRGNIGEVRVLDHNAIINQPFAMANATIQLVGGVLMAAFKDQMSDNDRKQLQKAIDDNDAKHLLEMSLKLQQTFGQ